MNKTTRSLIRRGTLCCLLSVIPTLQADPAFEELDSAVSAMVTLAETDAGPAAAAAGGAQVRTSPVAHQDQTVSATHTGGGTADKLFNDFWGVDTQAGAWAFDIKFARQNPEDKGGTAYFYSRKFAAGSRLPAIDHVDLGEWKLEADHPDRVDIVSKDAGSATYGLSEQSGALVIVAGTGTIKFGTSEVARLPNRPVKLEEMAAQGKKNLLQYGSR